MAEQEELKKAVGWRALKFVKPNTIVGVGTGSTVNYFIDALASIKDQIQGVVSSSESSTARLKNYGIPIFDCNAITHLDIYVDGADEINRHLHMLKGGGGALTREKIIAAIAKTFVCIVDASKVVDVLGAFPLSIEVIPMARCYVARYLMKLGGRPVFRQGVVTDNGNSILDVHDLIIDKPVWLENHLNAIAGVVTVGLFANRPADLALISRVDGIIEMTCS